VTVSGSGSKWTTTSGLTIGDLGFGTVILEYGGLLSVTGATTIGSGGALEFDGASTYATGALSINGGLLVALAPVNSFTGTATLGAGGVRISSGSFVSTFAMDFSGVGGITRVGFGNVYLSGSSTYTGATAVNAGTLGLTTGSANTAALGNTAISVASACAFAVNLGASPFSKMANAGTTGSGTAGATLTLNPGSTFTMAGTSLATFNLQQENSFAGPAFTIGGASGIAPTLIFDIGNAATGTDLINVTSTVRVLATGGDVTIDALAGDTSLTAGSYDLITSAGGFSGTNGNGLALSGTTLAISGTTYDLSLASSSTDDEILTVSASAPRAHPESEGDLLSATPAIGAGNGSTPLSAPSSIPEPSAAMSLLSAFGMAAAWTLRRRRRAR
jgi:T5SS/PEP-CTERM-associated repeat protein/autotransporter-associated beta strand protein